MGCFLYNSLMNKKDNILKNIYFTGFTLVILLSFSLIFQYIVNNKYEGMFFSWMIIFFIALISQHIITIKRKISYSMTHYSYIMFSLFMSMFIAFIIKFFVGNSITDMRWTNALISTLISIVILWFFKSLLWFWSTKVYLKSIRKDNELELLRQENEEIKIRLSKYTWDQKTEERQKKHSWKFWR